MIGIAMMGPSQSGPCVICGDTNYNLSCGGPTICPKCDCGNFDAATVEKQARVIADLRAQLAGVAQASLGHSALIPTPEQIEPILDDFLGVDSPHYEELRRRCAQRIFDLCAVMSGIPIKSSDNRISPVPSTDRGGS